MPGSPRIPPRYVPTLTEVVERPEAGTDAVPAVSAAMDGPVPWPAAPVALATPAFAPDVSLEDGIVHRVMQRVDVSLEPRLRAAIGALVTEQSQNLERRLRLEIESVVRECVADALASELPSQH
jgi:hypothetical protein